MYLYVGLLGLTAPESPYAVCSPIGQNQNRVETPWRERALEPSRAGARGDRHLQALIIFEGNLYRCSAHISPLLSIWSYSNISVF